jgi:drug/metabolite transporter (DMT)-like permease
VVTGEPTAGAGSAAPAPAPERRFPPIAEISVGSMMLIVIGGIYIASYFPDSVPLGLPYGLLAGAAALLAINVAMLRRLRDFAWKPFFLVFRWALLAYLVIAGMIGYSFVVDGARGSLLVILTLMLAMFAANIPIILSFSVARYQDPTQ